jgi:hypothetical protein
MRTPARSRTTTFFRTSLKVCATLSDITEQLAEGIFRAGPLVFFAAEVAPLDICIAAGVESLGSVSTPIPPPGPPGLTELVSASFAGEDFELEKGCAHAPGESGNCLLGRSAGLRSLGIQRPLKLDPLAKARAHILRHTGKRCLEAARPFPAAKVRGRLSINMRKR